MKKQQKVEFDIVDHAYRFFHDTFNEVNEDNLVEVGPIFAAVESFANFVNRRVDEVIDADIDLLNEYIKTHVPEDILWYKEVAPVLADLIIYWHDLYYKLKYPEQYKYQEDS